MNKPLILVVEDDAPVRNLITTTLKLHDYRFLTAANGETALIEASSHNPDIILLDLGLPDMDGIDIIRQIRSWSITPIEGLDNGADDYLTKPFSVDELLARLRVTQRRLSFMQETMSAQDSVFVNGPLKIDFSAGCACLNEEPLSLTPTEYKLLCLMARNVGKVLTHTYITEHVWGSSFKSDVASLRVFMATLRKKLESAPGAPQQIQTHIGVGYRMLRL